MYCSITGSQAALRGDSSGGVGSSGAGGSSGATGSSGAVGSSGVEGSSGVIGSSVFGSPSSSGFEFCYSMHSRSDSEQEDTAASDSEQ